MKTPWTRAEKSLFAAPILFIAMTVGAWLWRINRPLTIELQKATKIDGLHFSPDGKKLAVSFWRELNSPVPVQLFDLEARSAICTLEAPPPMDSQDPRAGMERLDPPDFTAPSWSPDGSKIVAGCNYVLAGPTQIPFPTLPNGKSAGSHSNNIARIAVWDAENGVLTFDKFYAPSNVDSQVDAVRFSSDGQRLFGSGQPPTIFDANSGKRLQVLTSRQGETSAAEINEDLGMWAQVSAKDGRVRVFDLHSRRLLWISPAGANGAGYFDLHWFGPILCALTPNGEGTHSKALLWDGKARQAVPSPPHNGLRDLSFNPDGRTLCYSGVKSMSQAANQGKMEREVVLWDYRQNRMLWHQPIPFNTYSLQWSPDGKWFSKVQLSANNDRKTLKVYDRNGHLQLEREVGDFLTAWSPNSQQIATIDVFEPTNWSRQIVMVPVGR